MVRIAIVGDVHDHWNPVRDRRALEFLKPDLVLFAGDFGNENVELVRNVSQLNMPKAAILGNHDCWWSAQLSPVIMKKHALSPTAVQEQIQLLGANDVGFKRLDFPSLNLSVVGGRPFAMGGDSIFAQQHCSNLYGINSMEESTSKISELAFAAPSHHDLIFLAHNGPTGLGSNADDICGRDFTKEPGDHGDKDLEEALKKCREGSLRVRLVVFGHMHKDLMVGGYRKMMTVSDGTVYVNSAVVPRIMESNGTSTDHAFTVVNLDHGAVKEVTECWVNVQDDDDGDTSIAHQDILFSTLVI